MENIKTNFTLKLTRKEKLERAIDKLYLTPGKAVTNYNICNKLMKELICDYPERYHYFQFSILQILPKTATDDEVIQTESLYKKKLLTIPFGMNDN